MNAWVQGTQKYIAVSSYLELFGVYVNLNWLRSVRVRENLGNFATTRLCGGIDKIHRMDIQRIIVYCIYLGWSFLDVVCPAWVDVGCQDKYCCDDD